MYRTTRTTMTAAAAVLAAISLAACGGSDEAGSGASQTTVTERSQTTTSSTTTATASPSSTAPAASSASSSPGATVGDGANRSSTAEPGAGTATSQAPTAVPGEPQDGGRLPNVGVKSSEASFLSPSGKIACTYQAHGSDEWVRCDLRGSVLEVPQSVEDDCEFDVGSSMYVDSTGAKINCVSDTVSVTRAPDAAEQAMWWKPTFGTAGPGDEIALPYGKSLGISTLLCESRSTGMTCTVGSHGFTLNDSSYSTW